MLRHLRLLCLLLLPAIGVAAGSDAAMLRQVVGSWLEEQDHWAFIQRVREYDGRTLKQERVESYDPSRGSASRWLLVSIDGRRPTPKEWSDWFQHHHHRARHATRKAVSENFDFERARVLEDSPERVRYELPLRSSLELLLPINKVELIVTINKHGPALEQVQARVSEPLKVALGLARIVNLDLDMQIEPPPPANPAEARPAGTAHAVVSKLGDRREYFWSNFRRVTPRTDPTDTAE